MEEYKQYEEDLELYGKAMNNAYQLITKERTLDDIYYELDNRSIETYPLPFNPIEEDGKSHDVLDVLIEYFTTTEEYEKCANLVKIKNICPKNF